MAEPLALGTVPHHTMMGSTHYEEGSAAGPSAHHGVDGSMDGSMHGRCSVCAAKAAGAVPPKRKCTCDSGMTQHRNRVDRVAERRDRCLLECATEGLVDLVEVYSFDDQPGCASERIHLVQEILSGYDPSSMVLPPDEEQAAFARSMLPYGWDKDRNVETVRALLDSDSVRVLLSRHAKSMDNVLRMAFAEDCQLGRMSGVRFWLERYDVNAHCVGRHAWYDDEPVIATPFYFAASGGDVDVMRVLLEHGANPHAAASDGTTPFFMACAHEHLRAMALLRDCRVDMSAPNQDGTSPSLIAANYCNLDARSDTRWDPTLSHPIDVSHSGTPWDPCSGAEISPRSRSRSSPTWVDLLVAWGLVYG